jgi:hypothetical protein
MYETGGMRRVHLRGRDNILKRLLVHGVAFNLSLILRQALGVGKPRQLQGLGSELLALCACSLTGWKALRMHFALQSSVFKSVLSNPRPALRYLDILALI